MGCFVEPALLIRSKSYKVLIGIMGLYCQRIFIVLYNTGSSIPLVTLIPKEVMWKNIYTFARLVRSMEIPTLFGGEKDEIQEVFCNISSAPSG